MDEYTLLYVDDDKDDHGFFAIALKKTGFNFKAEFASDGQEAIDSLISKRVLPKLIFLDLSMPIMDGMEFLRRKKDIAAIADIPTYVYSTSSRDLDKRESLALGAKAFITKPNAIHDMITVIKGIVEKHV